MTKMINCQKLQREAPALESAPYPGDLGQRIQENISQEAWDQWLSRQTMLINEYRLTVVEPKARQFLEQQMIEFLFGDGGETPAGYQPTE